MVFLWFYRSLTPLDRLRGDGHQKHVEHRSERGLSRRVESDTWSQMYPNKTHLTSSNEATYLILFEYPTKNGIIPIVSRSLNA